jgi:hypothetical protein
MTRFDVLARAACAVQFDVYASAPAARRRARRPGPWVADRAARADRAAPIAPADRAGPAVRRGTRVGRSLLG